MPRSARSSSRIAAQVDGEPCCAWMGPDGAGHFVKMVHNGIEYADMQFIAEAYDLLSAAGLTAAEVGRRLPRVEHRSSSTPSSSRSRPRCSTRSTPAPGGPLVDVIVDAAEQKGTGRWTVQTRPRARRAGLHDRRVGLRPRPASGRRGRARRGPRACSPARPRRSPSTTGTASSTTSGDALWSIEGRRLRPGPGADPRRRARSTAGTSTSRPSPGSGAVAASSAPGCSPRSATSTPPADLAEPARRPRASPGARRRARTPGAASSRSATAAGVPVPGFSSALAYYDTVRAERLPAALVQGLRDNFGAHTYGRIDRDGHLPHGVVGRPQRGRAP